MLQHLRAVLELLARLRFLSKSVVPGDPPLSVSRQKFSEMSKVQKVDIEPKPRFPYLDVLAPASHFSSILHGFFTGTGIA